MSNFNEYFKNKGVKTIVERFLGSADMYNPKYKITKMDYHIEDEGYPASYYIENSLTATHKVKLEYTINEEEDILFSEFEVPKEIDGAFIIEGSYRIATNKLNGDFDCRIKMSGTGPYTIKFDYDREYDINKKILKIKKTNPALGISEKDIIVKYEDLDKLPEDRREMLRLTDRQIKKWQIKLDIDYTPEFITQKLIDDCLAFGDDRLKDLIVDKQINSVPTDFMQFLFRANNGQNYISARRRITSYFTKNNRLQDQINAISTLCYRFFKGTAEKKKKGSGGQSIQVPPGVNAVNLESLGSKITIPETVAYNTTFSDIIDLADTPINQNTNLQNSLTVSTHITDEDVLFDVYDKNFTKITISYYDYLNHKVCASEYVDYETNTIKPNSSGQVEVKYRMKRRMVPVEEIDLIDLHPDYRLSGTTRRIPFINSTDSVRISMGTSMLKQAVPLVNAQRALVDTGASDELKNNVLNEKFKHSEGTVKEITEDKVVIELPDGNTTDIPRRTAIQSINDVAVYTEPKVKVGDKVRQGDIITGAVGLNKQTYKAGVNSLVLFHAYHGLVNEDALVISESYANRIASFSLIDIMVDINSSEALKWLAPIGSVVKAKMPVVTKYQAIRLDEINRQLNEKLGGLFDGDISRCAVERSLEVPNNIDEAVVSDILIQENKDPKVSKAKSTPNLAFAHTSDPIIKEYMDKKKEARKIIYEKFPEYIASDTLSPINLDNKTVKTVYTVRVRLIKRTIGMVGSKITNRYGGKGVVSTVKPDEMMPIMIDKNTGKQYRVEVVMNPYSTISRKIAGVLMECELGQIAHNLSERVDKLKRTKTGQKQIMPLITKYYPRYKDMPVEEFIQLHDSKPIEEVYYFNVGCYSAFTPEKVDEWMNELGLESQSEILMPETELADMDELRDNLSPEEYSSVLKSMKGKFRPVEKKLQCGWMTLEELYHIPSYANKVTTSLFGSDVSSRRDEPIMGRSHYRPTGQKISEMDVWAILSRNAKGFISNARKDTDKEDNQVFLNNLLGLGLTITDEKGYNQGGSDLKERMEQMKTKFRLKNQK